MIAARPKIAYLMNQYPMVSHSFIRREILAVERQGFEVLRVSLRGWDAALADAQDFEERERTRYVLQAGVLPLIASVLRTLMTSPARFFAALRLALRMGRRADRPLPYHLLYLAEACRMLPWLREFGARHLHAHFASNPAEVAMLVHALGGPTYSFTLHGTAEFDKLDFLGIREKVGRAAFVASVSAYGSSQIFRRIPRELWGRLHVVHCGLESAFYTGGPMSPGVPPVLLCIGRLSEEKGQLLLIQAAAQLATQGVPFTLVLAGDGPLRTEIESLARLHGLQERVRITGWISSAQVRDELIAARGLVLPSFSEGLPVVIMEAMSLRRPVIASCVGGIPELVRPGEHGWLFPVGDAAELTAAMAAFFAAPPEQLQRMGDAAYRRVVERHNIDTEAVKLTALFHTAIGKCK